MAEGQTILAGTVRRGGAPVDRAYVRVLDRDGEFTGERRTEADGAFRFYLAPGRWSLDVRAPGDEPVRRDVEVPAGEETRVDVDLPPPG